MIRTVFVAGAACAVLAGSLALPAQAQPIYGDPGPYVQGGPGVPVQENRPGVVYDGRSAFFGGPAYCIKLCEQDNTPCDPIYYKRADMRCNADGR